MSPTPAPEVHMLNASTTGIVCETKLIPLYPASSSQHYCQEATCYRCNYCQCMYKMHILWVYSMRPEVVGAPIYRELSVQVNVMYDFVDGVTKLKGKNPPPNPPRPEWLPAPTL